MVQKVRNPNLGTKVHATTTSWSARVIQAWGTEWSAPDHGVYEFSQGRKFDSTDKTNSGIYGGGAV